MSGAVQYAEEVLDVHGPWQEAQRRLALYTEALGQVLRHKDQLREYKSTLADRTAEIRAEAPSVPGYPTQVQARRDFVKLLIDNDSRISEIEDDIAQCQSSIDTAQTEVRHHELGLSVLSARLTELGGLLHFYSAAKEAQTAKHVYTTTQGE